jgi:hypothetical protein
VAGLQHFVQALKRIFDFFNPLYLDGLDIEQPMLLVFYFVKSNTQVVKPTLGKPTH